MFCMQLPLYCKSIKKQEKAAKLREFKVFSHSTRTVLHVVVETSHGKDRRFLDM